MIGILVDTDGDLMLDTTLDVDGKLYGLATGVCDADIVERVLDAYPGDFKNVPTVGANVRGMIGGSVTAFSRARIIDQLKSQKIKVNSVIIDVDQNIIIDYDE